MSEEFESAAGSPTYTPGQQLFDQIWWYIRVNLPLLGILLILTLCIVSAILYRPILSKNPVSDVVFPDASSRLLTLPYSQTVPSRFVMIEDNDLYICETVTATYSCDNLTRNPTVEEIQLVYHKETERIAFYGQSGSVVSLYTLDLISRTITVPTYHSDTTGLYTDFVILTTLAPAFSPDGSWVAFPAQSVKNDVIELFAAHTDGQQVLRVTDMAYQVLDYTWLSDDEIMIVFQRPNGKLEYRKAYLRSGEFLSIEMKRTK